VFKDSGRAFREEAEWAIERLATKWSVGEKIRMWGIPQQMDLILFIQSNKFVVPCEHEFWDGGGREAVNDKIRYRVAPDSVRIETGGIGAKNV